MKSKILMDSLQILCPKCDSWLLCSTSSHAVLEKACVEDDDHSQQLYEVLVLYKNDDLGIWVIAG